MKYHFQNLEFEGGGVKGIAYVGALQVLENKGSLGNIRRVGGLLPERSPPFWWGSTTPCPRWRPS